MNSKKKDKTARKKNKIFYFILFFIGAISLFFQVKIYRKTIIDVYPILYLILGVGLLVSVLDYKRYQFTYKSDGLLSYVNVFIQSTVSFGGIIGLFFLALNFYLPNKEVNKEDFLIIDRYSMSGPQYHREERKPVFIIDYKEEKKELVYTHKYFDEMNDYKTVTINTKKGLLGFDIITDRVLKK